MFVAVVLADRRLGRMKGWRPTAWATRNGRVWHDVKLGWKGEPTRTRCGREWLLHSFATDALGPKCKNCLRSRA